MTDWPEMQAKQGRKARLSVPPLKKPPCSVEGCQNQSLAKGLCNVHYQRIRNARTKGIPIEAPRVEAPTRPAEQTSPPPPREEVKEDDVKGLVVVTMTTLAMTLDESFAVIDAQGNLLPHAKDAIDQMTPFLKMYGGSLARMSPYIGFAMGCLALGAPAFNATSEIIAGVRIPRILRKSPDDVYSTAWKNRQAKHAEKKAQEKPQEPPASEQTVETKAA